MSRFVDSIIAYRILNLLVTPFNKTEAYRLGIIDEKGKELKKMRDLNTVQLRDAYTLLHRLVFRLKKIIEKVPIENKKLVSLAAAYSLIREYVEKDQEPITLEKEYINKLNTDLNEEVLYVENYLKKEKMKTFRHFSEDMGVGAVSGGVATNNAAATPGIGGLPPDDPPVSKKAQKKYRNQNNMFRRP